MSDRVEPTPSQRPVISDAVQEVQGVFPSDAALQDAISRLTLAGFDRADISVQSGRSDEARTPEAGIENPNTDVDAQQQRTLHTGLAASVGALAAAGAVVATGGAALPAVAAAVAGGVGLGGLMQGTAAATDKIQHEAREEAAATGDLVLAVHLRAPERRAAAEEAMRSAGALSVVPVLRQGPNAATI